jgi:hypothetical protein
MTPIELAEDFINNTSKMVKYNEAIALLREIGFEIVLRRLGEPSAFSLDHPQHLSISAFEHAEKRGWYQLLEFIFDFQSSMVFEGKKNEVGDFGAKEHLRTLGYSSELLQSIEGVSNA